MEHNNVQIHILFAEGARALKKHGWLTIKQKDLASSLKVSPTHLSQVFNGKKKSSPNLQMGVAQALNVPYEDIIKIGRNIINNKGFFPYIGQIENTSDHSEEQATIIMELTKKSLGIQGHLDCYKPKYLDDFIKRKISHVDFYKMYYSELTALIETIKRN